MKNNNNIRMRILIMIIALLSLSSVVLGADPTKPIAYLYPEQTSYPGTNDNILGYCNSSDSDGGNLSYDYFFYKYSTSIGIDLMDYNNYCYQETANLTDGCGEATGTYSYSGFDNWTLMFDGNWSSYANYNSDPAYFYVNYTIPENATSKSVWVTNTIIFADLVTLDESCFYGSTLQLQIKAQSGGLFGHAYHYCYNSTDWVYLNQDGWRKLYEESMLWHFNTTDTPVYPEGENSLILNFSYLNTTIGESYYLTCVASDGENFSEISDYDVTGVNNQPPTMDSSSLSPDPSYTNDTLVGTCTATDIDGDDLIYTAHWYLNNESLDLSTQLDNFDSKIANWVPTSGTDYDESDTRIEGSGSLRSAFNSVDVNPAILTSSVNDYGDLSNYSGVATGQPTDGVITFLIHTYYNERLNGSVYLFLGNDASNGIEITTTISVNENSEGWSLVTFNLSDSTVVNSMNWSAVDYTVIKIYFTTANKLNIHYDDMRIYNNYEDFEYSTTNTFSLSNNYFSRYDNITFSCRANDNSYSYYLNGGSSDWLNSSQLTISNHIPEITSVSFTPESPYTNDTLLGNCTSGTDADGDSLSFEYQWYVNDVVNETTQNLSSENFNNNDDVYLSCRVTDGINNSDWSDSSEVTISNYAPSMVASNITPSSIYIDSDLSGFCEASDYENDNVSYAYKWYLNGVVVSEENSSIYQEDSNSSSTGYSYIIDGKQTGYLQVDYNKMDGRVPRWVVKHGSFGAYNITSSDIPQSCQDYSGTYYRFRMLSTNYAVGSSGCTLYRQISRVQCYNGGWTTIGQSVSTDGCNAIGSFTSDVSKLTDGNWGTYLGYNHNDYNNWRTSIYEPARLYEEAMYFMLDYYEVGVERNVNNLTYEGLSIGDNITFSCMVYDGVNSSDWLNSSVMTVENSPPTIQNISITPDPAYTNDTLIGNCNGSDVDDDSLTYEYLWYNDDGLIYEDVYCLQNQSNVSTACGGLDTGSYSANAGAWSDGDWATGVSNPVVGEYYYYSNYTIPENATYGSEVMTKISSAISGVAYANGTIPQGCLNGSTLQLEFYSKMLVSNYGFEVKCYDYDTTAFTLVNTYGYYRSDVFYEESVNWYMPVLQEFSNMTSSVFDKGDNITFSCRVNDTTNISAWSNSSTLTISNSVPITINSSFTPDPAYTNYTLTGSCTVTDEDSGDTLTYEYQWYVNGVVNETTQNLTSTNFVNFDNITLSCRVNDGDDYSNWLNSSTLTISNYVPVTQTSQFTPDPAYTNDTLLGNCTGSDLDTGDSLTYEYQWYKNDVLVVDDEYTYYQEDFDTLIDDSTSFATSTVWYDGDYGTNPSHASAGGFVDFAYDKPSNFYSGGTTYWIVAYTTGTHNITIPEQCLEENNVTLRWEADTISPYLFKGFCYNSSDEFELIHSTTSSSSHRAREEALYFGLANTTDEQNLTSSYFVNSDNMTLSCRVYDQTSYGDWLNSSTITISNSLPITQTPTFTPDPAYTNDTLVGNCNGSDVDDDSLTYEYLWYKNDVQVTTSTTCYQETTNESNVNDGDCNLNYNGNYTIIYGDLNWTNPENTYDGNFSTYGANDPVTSGSSIMDVIYYKPNVSLTSATWKIGYSYGGQPVSTNHTIPDVCFDYNEDYILLRFESFSNLIGGANTKWKCYNGTDYQYVVTEINTYKDIYEEAIIWNYEIDYTNQNLTSSNFVNFDNVTLSCRVYDQTAYGDWENSSVLTISNTLPVIQTSSITPDPAYTNDTLLGTCSATDIDSNDVLTYEYQWYVNDVANDTTQNLTSSNFVNFDNITLGCRGYDGTNYTSWLNSSTLTISNYVPVTQTSQFTPDPAYTNDTLVGNCTGTDVDSNDVLTYEYQWYVNGTASQTTQNLTSSYFVNFDNITLSCRVYDQTSYGDWENSTTLTISNSLPVTQTSTFTPDPAYTNDTLLGSCTSTDEDSNDVITYEYQWYVNGVINDTTQNLAITNFVNYDNLTLSCRVYDQVAYGDWLNSTTLTITNTLPIAQTSSITPDPAYTNDTLVGNCTGTDVDDNDVISYVYQWYVNDVANATTQNLSSTNFEKSDEVILQCTVYDGHEYSTSLNSSTLTISNLGITTPTDLALDETYEVGDTVFPGASGSVDGDGDSITYYYKYVHRDNDTIIQDWSANNYTTQEADFGDWIKVYTKAVTIDANSSEYSENFLVIKKITLPFYDNFSRDPNGSSIVGNFTEYYSTKDLSDGDAYIVYNNETEEGYVIAQGKSNTDVDLRLYLETPVSTGTLTIEYDTWASDYGYLNKADCGVGDEDECYNINRIYFYNSSNDANMVFYNLGQLYYPTGRDYLFAYENNLYSTPERVYHYRLVYDLDNENMAVYQDQNLIGYSDTVSDITINQIVINSYSRYGTKDIYYDNIQVYRNVTSPIGVGDNGTVEDNRRYIGLPFTDDFSRPTTYSYELDRYTTNQTLIDNLGNYMDQSQDSPDSYFVVNASGEENMLIYSNGNSSNSKQPARWNLYLNETVSTGKLRWNFEGYYYSENDANRRSYFTFRDYSNEYNQVDVDWADITDKPYFYNYRFFWSGWYNRFFTQTTTSSDDFIANGFWANYSMDADLDADTIRVYVNGVEFGTTYTYTGNISSIGYYTELGGTQTSYTKIDDVVITKQALTIEEPVGLVDLVFNITVDKQFSSNATLYVNGVEQSNVTLNDTYFNGDNIVSVTALTVYNNVSIVAEDGSTDLVLFERTNIEPNAPTVRINPNYLIGQDDNVAGYCTGTDNNSDVLKYNYIWYVNDVAVRNGTTTSWTNPGVEVLADTIPSSYYNETDYLKFSCAGIDPKEQGAFKNGTAKYIFSDNNYAPTMGTVTIVPYGLQDTQVSFNVSANATDIDLDDVLYEWRFVKNSQYQTVSTTAYLTSGVEYLIGTLSNASTVSGDTYYVRARAYDGEDYSDWMNSNVITIDNTPPTITISNITTTPYENTTLVAYCNGTDIDSEQTLTYTKTWYKNGISSYTGDTLPYGETQQGENWTLGCVAYDGQNYSVELNSSTVTIIGTENVPVLDTLTLIANTTIATGTCSVSDDDGDKLDYSVIWYNNGVSVLNETITEQTQGENELFYYNGTLTTGDELVFSCEATDNQQGSTGYTNTTLTIPLITFNYVVSDIATTEIEVSWTTNAGLVKVYLDDELQATTSLIKWTFEGLLSNTNYDIKLIPVSGAYTGLPRTFNETTLVSDNNVPTMSTVTFSPTTLYTENSITGYCKANDIDTASLFFTYVWTKNNVTVKSGVTSMYNRNTNVAVGSLLSSSYVYNDNITLTCIAYDGIGSSSSLSANISVQNTEPVVDEELINIELTELAYNCSHSYSDADGDEEITPSYVWYLNGVVNQTGNSSIFLIEGTEVDDELVCQVNTGDIYHNISKNSSAFLVGDFDSPVISGFSFPSSVFSDTSTLIEVYCQDNVGIANQYPKLRFINPNFVEEEYELTYQGSLEDGNPDNDYYYGRYITFSIVGVYTNFEIECKDGNGNSDTEQSADILYSNARQDDTPPAGGGGSGVASGYCGDGLCTGLESSVSCPEDCGESQSLFRIVESSTGVSVSPGQTRIIEFEVISESESDLEFTTAILVTQDREAYEWMTFEGGIKAFNFEILNLGGLSSDNKYIRFYISVPKDAEYGSYKGTIELNSMEEIEQYNITISVQEPGINFLSFLDYKLFNIPFLKSEAKLIEGQVISENFKDNGVPFTVMHLILLSTLSGIGILGYRRLRG